MCVCVCLCACVFPLFCFPTLFSILFSILSFSLFHSFSAAVSSNPGIPAAASVTASAAPAATPSAATPSAAAPSTTVTSAATPSSAKMEKLLRRMLTSEPSKSEDSNHSLDKNHNFSNGISPEHLLAQLVKQLQQ